MIKTEENVVYRYVYLPNGDSFSFSNKDGFLYWICRNFVKTYSTLGVMDGKPYVDFSNINFSGNDMGWKTPDGKPWYLFEREFGVRSYLIYRNDVLFDIRIMEKEIIDFFNEKMEYRQIFGYCYRHNPNVDVSDSVYGEEFVSRGYRHNPDVTYRYRIDPVPFVHKYGNCGRGRSHIGSIARMINSEEYKKYGKKGHYPSSTWDFKEHSCYGQKSWKDCTKKKHQWEK